MLKSNRQREIERRKSLLSKESNNYITNSSLLETLLQPQAQEITQAQFDEWLLSPCTQQLQYVCAQEAQSLLEEIVSLAYKGSIGKGSAEQTRRMGELFFALKIVKIDFETLTQVEEAEPQYSEDLY